MGSPGNESGAPSAAYAPEPGDVPANAAAPSPAGTRHGAGDPAIDRALRTAELDGLRAVAVLLVFAYHTLLEAVPLQRYVLPDALYLEAGVEVLFVLSGFLVYSPFVRAHPAGGRPPRLVDYQRRRALRTYPAYGATLAVLLALGWVFVDTTRRLLSEATLTQGYRRAELMARRACSRRGRCESRSVSMPSCRCGRCSCAGPGGTSGRRGPRSAARWRCSPWASPAWSA